MAMDTLHAVSTEEVVRLIRLATPKSSPLDCMPTSLLKEAAEVMAPLSAKLANLSFTTGVFPARYKLGHVIPLLRKSGLPKDDPANYKPITNLPTFSKLRERLALNRLVTCASVWQFLLLPIRLQVWLFHGNCFVENCE